MKKYKTDETFLGKTLVAMIYLGEINE